MVFRTLRSAALRCSQHASIGPQLAAILVVTAVATLSSPARAAVYVETWTLPADYEAFGMLDYYLPHIVGPTRLTVRSSRPFLGDPAVSAYQEEHFHEIPSDGAPVYGYRANRYSQTALRVGTQAFTVDYTTSQDWQYAGCCTWGWGVGEVSFIREAHYTPMIYIDFSFAPGSDPITVTMSVSPAPEPAIWAMLLIGFAGVGSALRRSRNNRTRDWIAPRDDAAPIHVGN